MSDREPLAEGREHLTISGTFQSDKYTWCPPGFLPLKMSDPMARDLLLQYAYLREMRDPEFSRDLREAVTNEFSRELRDVQAEATK